MNKYENLGISFSRIFVFLTRRASPAARGLWMGTTALASGLH
ncbi:MAG: hypothetical protein PHY73_00905 [Candidatus Omnitrophica bacterium]|nr:hypothetical protein [Candidatus Omnitrophota bacterium]